MNFHYKYMYIRTETFFKEILFKAKGKCSKHDIFVELRESRLLSITLTEISFSIRGHSASSKDISLDSRKKRSK